MAHTNSPGSPAEAERADIVSAQSTGPRSSPMQRSGRSVVAMAIDRTIAGMASSRSSASSLVASTAPTSCRATRLGSPRSAAVTRSGS